MDKLNSLTSVWKHSFVLLCILVLNSGASGSLWFVMVRLQLWHHQIAGMHSAQLGELASKRNLSTQLIQQILRAQQCMKAQADSHRSKHEFQVGDLVYLKLQPHL